MMAMSSATANATLIQRALRHRWLLREVQAEALKQQQAADTIQSMWKGSQQNRRKAAQASRLDGREAAYVDALKAHRRQVRQERRAYKRAMGEARLQRDAAAFVATMAGPVGGAPPVRTAPAPRASAAAASVPPSFFRAVPPPSLALPGQSSALYASERRAAGTVGTRPAHRDGKKLSARI